MKRRFTALLALILIIALTSCAAFLSTTQTYLAAFETTNNTDSFRSHTEFNLQLDLSQASDESKKDFEKLKDIKVNVDELNDNKNNKGQVDVFLALGEITMNMRIYSFDGKTYMQDGRKYVLITPEGYGKKFENADKSYDSYSKFYKDMQKIWIGAVEKEILAKERNSIVYTPDGDMKVDQLSLELTDVKAKNILVKLADAVEKNEELKRAIVESSLPYKPDDISESEFTTNIRNFFNKLPGKIAEPKDKFHIGKLKLTARIDKDSYIIDQTLEGKLSLKEKEGTIGISFDSKTTKWDFNRKINIDIPNIKKEDIEPIESYDMRDFAKDFQEAVKNN